MYLLPLLSYIVTVTPLQHHLAEVLPCHFPSIFTSVLFLCVHIPILLATLFVNLAYNDQYPYIYHTFYYSYYSVYSPHSRIIPLTYHSHPYIPSTLLPTSPSLLQLFCLASSPPLYRRHYGSWRRLYRGFLTRLGAGILRYGVYATRYLPSLPICLTCLRVTFVVLTAYQIRTTHFY